MKATEARSGHSFAAASQRRRQVSGLLILLAVIVAATIYHAGISQVFPPGWWRIW